MMETFQTLIWVLVIHLLKLTTLYTHLTRCKFHHPYIMPGFSFSIEDFAFSRAVSGLQSNLEEGTEIPTYPLPLHAHTAFPAINNPQQSGTFVTIDESVLALTRFSPTVCRSHSGSPLVLHILGVWTNIQVTCLPCYRVHDLNFVFLKKDLKQ